MYHSSIPLEYWDTVFESTLFVINRLPSSPNLNISPFEKLFHSSPDYQFLHTLGCECFPLLRPYNHHKLQPRAESCVFLGYSSLHKGYKCFHIPTQRLYISRHVSFIEDYFPFSKITPIPKPSAQPVSTTLAVLPVDSTPLFPTPAPQSPILSSPVTSPYTASTSSLPLAVTGTHSMVTRSKTNSLRPKQYHSHQVYTTTKHPLLLSLDDTEPTCFSQAVKSPQWRLAMAAELDALAKNQTWQLVDPPPGSNIIGCKWVYKLKKKADGSLERHKAILVAKGFNQEEGVDYFETFSPVVKPTTIRVVLTIALAHCWPLHQLDVNNAFLHGDLTETVFMRQPPSFIDSLYPNKVCLLKKALYGLKQASRAWFHKLKAFLLLQGFHCSQADNSLFICQKQCTTLYLLVYVDDIVVTGNSAVAVQSLIATLHTEFSIKDLGSLNYFLGLQVSTSADSLFLTQSLYIKSILDRTHMAGAKPCKTPMDSSLKLSKFSGNTLTDPSEYCMTVGSLQYATLTRPDISFAVNKLSQFMANPSDLHWQAVKRLLRYLKGTIHHGLHLRKSSSLHLTAYSDADWAGCPDDRRSTTGYAIFLGSNLVSWSSKKQPTVARSSTEAEYRSMAMATSELIWLRSLLTELQISLSSPPLLYCDNLGATFLAANPVFHARTKHVEIDFHFVRDQLASNQLKVHFLCSTDQLADIFTKSLPSARFLILRPKLTVSEDPLCLRGAVEVDERDELETSSSARNGLEELGA